MELAILATGIAAFLNETPSYAAAEAETAVELYVCRKHEKELCNLQLQENRLARRREREAAELERRQSRSSRPTP